MKWTGYAWPTWELDDALSETAALAAWEAREL
jgi:hypothetical protein